MTDRVVTLVSLMVVGGLSGCLTYESFLEKRHDRYCEQQEICNEELGVEIDCNVPGGADTGYGNDECDFDPKLARDCLRGVWTCADVPPSFVYPIPPQACDGVCGGTVETTP